MRCALKRHKKGALVAVSHRTQEAGAQLGAGAGLGDWMGKRFVLRLLPFPAVGEHLA